ncbi:amidase [Enterovirga sp. CN4-39]|uniref:amidase n=1 Tax=Enterovirga sp. CN4-39 TaxID=3400910 RepID=UPI003C047EB4
MTSRDAAPAGSGRALAAALSAGTTRLATVLAEYLSAIEAREPELQTFAHLDRDAFLAGPREKGPLAGLPVGVKDIIDTVDMPTACGSPIYASRMPVSDAPVVSMVRRAGGTIAGKTVTTEFAAVNPGPTRNPHNPSHTPGGSSSGSAAAVAAGFLPFSIGTQTGGSIVRPASFCGVAAIKPTIGLLPGFCVKGFSWTLDTIGLFARDVRDLAFFAEAITGQDLAVPEGELSQPRFGIARLKVWDEMEPAMAEAVETACRTASARGAAVTTLPVPAMFEDAHQAHYAIQDYELARSLAYEFDNHQDLLSPKLRDMIRGGLAISTETYVAALADGRAARFASDALFAGTDVLIWPSASGAAPAGIEATGSPNQTRLWTLLGLPTVNVPGLADASGMPLGIQIVGRLGRDRDVLRAAAWLEDALREEAR